MANDDGSSSLFMDGELTKDEALAALRMAAERATDALPNALAACETDADRQQVMAARDSIVLAYLTALQKSLMHTAPHFEKLAKDLETEAKSIRKKAKELRDTVAAINLFTELAKLAASLALAFA
ncbi:MAG TPA: hypothetical protein VHP37_30860 [Burkholderiales bacterium]|nr:hypothetical protein [Burkholderiales bacterium]